MDQASALPDFVGLQALRQLGHLNLYGNQALTSLDGLEQVVELPRGLYLYLNTALTSVAGLRNVTHSGRSVFLGSNHALSALAFDSLTSINGGLAVRYMPSLTSLSGLDALSSVTGEIDIFGNDNVPQAEVDAFLDRLGH
jgi:hypothetical protein